MVLLDSDSAGGLEAPSSSCTIDPDCIDENPCTDDACDEGGCVFVPSPGLPCDDAVACTALDTCDEDGNCAGTPDDLACDDSDPCTADSCDSVTGCANDPIPGCGAAQSQVPSMGPVGLALLVVLLAAAGALFMLGRRWSGA